MISGARLGENRIARGVGNSRALENTLLWSCAATQDLFRTVKTLND